MLDSAEIANGRFKKFVEALGRQLGYSRSPDEIRVAVISSWSAGAFCQ